MIRFQIQSAYPGKEFRDGTNYIIGAEEVGVTPFVTYAEAHRVVRAQMARDRRYGRSMRRYQIVEITHRIVGRFSSE